MTPKTFGLVLSFLLLGQLGFVLFNQIFEVVLNIFGFSLFKANESASAGSDSVSMFLYAGFSVLFPEELIFAGRAYGHLKIWKSLCDSDVFPHIWFIHGNIPQFFLQLLLELSSYM